MKSLRTFAFVTLGLVMLLALFAWAGEGEQQEMTPAQMKEMFSQCFMCKNLVPYMDKPWFNTWSMEVYNLKNGMVMVERLGDKSGMADYKTLFATFEKAGGECKKLSDTDAKKMLCQHCQGMHSVMKAGAKEEWVLTKDGSVGVLTSDKPATVKMIHAQADKMRQMFAHE